MFGYEPLLRVLQHPTEFRTEFDCAELMPYFRTKVRIFRMLRKEIVCDVIKHCEFERKCRDEVLIKQGENGDKLYIILKGACSIYVTHDKETPQEILQQVEQVCAKDELVREHLGHYVWNAGEGKSFGEIALLKDDCIRTATVVADTDTDLVVIDRNLYNRSVRDVLEREYKQKSHFVEENQLFKSWPSKQRRHMVVALKKENVKYGSPLTKQGNQADSLFFILNGEVEITYDQNNFQTQYEDLWRDMETLLPGLLPRVRGINETPYQSLQRKKAHHKLLQMCLLGSQEIIGALEVILGMTTSLENAIVTREAEVFMLSKENYVRLFNKKYAKKTVDDLRERLTMRLYLYIHRSELLNSRHNSPFLRFISFMLQDENALDELKKLKRKERDEKKGIISAVTGGANNDEVRTNNKEAEQINSMLKLLDMRPSSARADSPRPTGRLPGLESGQKVIIEIEKGLESWIQRTRKCDSPEPSESSSRQRTSSFHGNELLKPIYHQTRSLFRSKTPTLLKP